MGDVIEVVSVAVGHGDATLINWKPATGKGSTILVDGGPKGSGSRIKKALAERQLTHLDVVVLTHVDADHVDGLLELASDIGIGLYLGPCVRAFERHSWLFEDRVLNAIKKARALESVLSARGTTMRCPVEDYSLVLGDRRLQLKVLSPAGRYIERLLLDEDALELFSTFPVPQGWLLDEPPALPDEPGDRAALRRRLRNEASIAPRDADIAVDGASSVADVAALREEVMRSAELAPEFFGNPVLNDTSLVLQVDALLDHRVRRRVLLTGDLENWAYLLAKHGPGLDSDVLKASHHGGYVYVEKSPTDFDSVYQWLRPSVVFVSACGQHDLPKRGFRDNVLRWGATLFCPNTRGREVVYGPSPDVKSCFKAFACSKADQKTTTLTITAETMTANVAACSSGVGRHVLPVVRVQQHVIQPSPLLDRFHTAEVEKYVQWIEATLRTIHLERKTAHSQSDLQPIGIETLRRYARAEELHTLAARLDDVIEYAGRHGRVWHSQLRYTREEAAVYSVPTDKEIARVRAWLRERELLLVTTTRKGMKWSLDDILEGMNFAVFGRHLARSFLFPASMFREAFWPSLAQDFKEAFVVRQRDEWLLCLKRAKTTELGAAVERVFGADVVSKYGAAAKHDPRRPESVKALAEVEEAARVVIEADEEAHFRYQLRVEFSGRMHLQSPEQWIELG